MADKSPVFVGGPWKGAQVYLVSPGASRHQKAPRSLGKRILGGEFPRCAQKCRYPVIRELPVAVVGVKFDPSDQKKRCSPVATGERT